MNRENLLNQLKNDNYCRDILIIGGEATGLGIAVNAASRGFKTVLLEQHDFAKGTSSRSTKLVHGGARYLVQGDIFGHRRSARTRDRIKRKQESL